ncbi:hypothetical protein K402DRAFT_425261 [Aulographum hederae CBS 113979]|uniref:Uncharacterized protein n=1 Tax=Aulographum hederae CBS 113979 TaxID=1176131 RepID=A0A6G1GLM4_9PEZI|nr:hypothetical protein K402DRAFT_425261 [Aulographum hederae CBS 113979]
MSSYTNGSAANGNGAQNGHNSGKDYPIAIVGMACRFPQDAENNEKLWDMMDKGRSASTEFPADRFNIDAHWHPDPAHGGTTSCRGGHFLKKNGINFDAPFFSLTKNEVMSMDPQQRIMMENVYEALENAGIPMDQAIGSETSVYAGAFNKDYDTTLNMDATVLQKYLPTGNSVSILSNRLSWFFDFKGPSLTVDTACSSSLIAMHLACESLRHGDAEISIVTGVNIIERPETMYRMSNIGFMSPDSKCYSFDHRANGYSRGEGVGSVILKPLDAALRDGDSIRAVVRATGINQDGRTPGMTVPSKDAQIRLIQDTYRRAGLDLADCGYVEAHGTGTAAGDPIEAGAIAQAFQDARGGKHPLVIGAIKSNIGHLEGASGVAGIIKSVQVLEKGIIPPNINFEKVNPKIPVEKWHIQFPLQPTPWPEEGLRRASINSFGFGGSNAHCVLDDAYHYLQAHKLSGVHNTVSKVPTQDEVNALSAGKAISNGAANGHANGSSKAESKSKVFVLSAYDEGGIKRTAESYKEYLSELPLADEDKYLDDLAWTLAKKRTLFSWKAFCVASSKEDLVAKLPEATRTAAHSRKRDVPILGYVFTGQGAQWATMGIQLMAYPTFAASVEEATAYINSLGSPFDVLKELNDKDSNMSHPSLSQTICTVLQVALVDLMAEWKILPSRVIGHSSGEIAAAYAAGALSKESAWKVAYYRGVVSGKATSQKGAMMAVGVSQDDLAPFMAKVDAEIKGELVMACYNSPRNITVSGDEAKIDRLNQLLDDEKLFARKLKVQNAYHSGHMKTVSDEYLKLMGTLSAGKVPKGARKVTMFSTVEGKPVDAAALREGSYWVANMVSPVKFTQALFEMISPSQGKSKLRLDRGVEIPIQHIVEVGPHPALQSAVKDTMALDQALSGIHYSSMVARNKNAVDTALTAAGQLFTHGHTVDLHAVNFTSRFADGQTLTQPSMLVDLPPYSFNHKESYWGESRVSKNFRFRKAPVHDLLGEPIPEWNANSPKWKRFIRVNEVPWVKDHKVTNSIVYPGVGYLVMAIEAARQLEHKDDVVTGYRLREIAIKTALQIPEGENGIETMFSMTHSAESSIANSGTWRDFKVESYNPNTDEWTEHCRGQITVEHDTPTGPIDAGREAKEEARIFKEQLDSAAAICQTPVDMARSYAELETIGLAFGPMFRNLRDVSRGNGTGDAIGQISVPDVKTIMPKRHMADHVIHPATMDSMLHIFLAATQDSTQEARLSEPMVPIFMSDVWVSAGISKETGRAFKTHGKAGKVGHKKIEASVTVWDALDDTPVAFIKNMQATPLQSGSAEQSSRQQNWNIDWKPDMDVTADVTKTTNYLRDLMAPPPLSHPELLSIANDINLAAVIYVTDAIKTYGTTARDDILPHLKKYHAWLMYQNDKINKGEIMHQKPEWQKIMNDPKAKKELLDKVENSGPEGKLLVRMGSAMPQILANDADALQLMFGDDLLDAYYQKMSGTDRIHEAFRSFLKTYSHKYVNLKVLEIGAGTGGTTIPILETLAPVLGEEAQQRDSRLTTYTYTDISPSFFEKAKSKFKDFSHVLEFKRLDVEKDINDQGFDLGQYDLIIAANVLHATQELSVTLSNTRKLLRPGGKLLLHEANTPQNFLCGSFCFGTLPGWWLSKEEMRPWGPLLEVEKWDNVLKNNGFTGVDLELKDYVADETHAQSVMVATAKDTVTPERTNPETLIVVPTSGQADALLAPLQEALGKIGVKNTSVCAQKDLEGKDLKETIVVMLNELYEPILTEPSEPQFLIIRHLLTTALGLVWVQKNTTKNPEVALIWGLIRTIRWERDLDDHNLITLEINDPAQSTELTVEHIVKVFNYQFLTANDQKDAEYCSRGGMIETDRLIHADYVDNFIASLSTKPSAQTKLFGEDPSRALKLATDQPGILSALKFIDDPMYPQPMKDDDVEIEIKASGLNFRDIMSAMGEVRGDTLGAEGAGVVSRVGKGVTKCKIGDRVVFLSTYTGSFCTYARTQEAACVVMPDNLSFEVAAGFPVIFGTVYYCLFDIARLQKGESILIHAAAGGVGQAAIMLAQKAGATIYATVSSHEKRKIVMEQFGIPEEHIFSSRDLSFVKGVMRVTNGKGVDVILNSLAGEALRRSWDCIACFGRFIEIGKRDIYSNGRLEMYPFRKSVMFASCDLETVIALDPSVTSRLLEETMKLYKEGWIRETTPFNVFTFSEMEASFRLLQSGKHIGKVVLTADKNDKVQVVPKAQSAYQFSHDATYILSGGLGGLGRSLSHWMVSRGARNIVFLSRSGASTDTARELVSDLEAKGARVNAFACDVSKKDAVAQCFAEVNKTMPPIKGCIQGAMVLKDSALEYMTHEKYLGAIIPKVQGSWNLSECMPKDIDFFIMLSSICGILGNRGQSNYAAGNTYQDALARYRLSQGLTANSIDLGSILSVGFIAENTAQVTNLAFADGGIREDEFHGLLEYHIDHRNPTQTDLRAQVAIGLPTTMVFQNKGIPVPSFLSTPLFTQLRSVSDSAGGEGEEDSSGAIKAALQASKTAEDAAAVVMDAIVKRLSSVMSLPKEDIDSGRPIHHYGVDSLVAVEFRNWIAKGFGADVPVLDIMGNDSIAQLSEKIVKLSKVVSFGGEDEKKDAKNFEFKLAS